MQVLKLKCLIERIHSKFLNKLLLMYVSFYKFSFTVIDHDMSNACRYHTALASFQVLVSNCINSYV